MKHREFALDRLPFDNEDVPSDDVIGTSTCASEGQFQVVEDVRGLSFNVSFTDNRTRFIEGDLCSDIDRFHVAGHDYGIRERRILEQPVGIEILDALLGPRHAQGDPNPRAAPFINPHDSAGHLIAARVATIVDIGPTDVDSNQPFRELLDPLDDRGGGRDAPCSVLLDGSREHFFDLWLIREERGAFVGRNQARHCKACGGSGRIAATQGAAQPNEERPDLSTRNVTATAEEVGVSEKAVKTYLNAHVPDYKVLARTPRNSRKNYTTQELIDFLREAATGSGPLAHTTYKKFVDDFPTLPDGRDRPGPQAMGLRFGTWTATLHAAGLHANPRSGPRSDLDDVKAVQSVVACWRALERPPTVDAYDKWQRDKDEHASPATVRKMFDSWDIVRAWQIRYGIPLDPSDADVAIPPGLASAGPGFVPYSPADEAAILTRNNDELESHIAGLEKAVRNHARIQNKLADAIRDNGREPLGPSTAPFFDLAFIDHDGALVVTEIKSCTDLNLEGQLRHGVGQVLRYAHQLRKTHETVRPVLVTQLEPPAEWQELLGTLDIAFIHESKINSGLRAVLCEG